MPYFHSLQKSHMRRQSRLRWLHIPAKSNRVLKSTMKSSHCDSRFHSQYLNRNPRPLPYLVFGCNTDVGKTIITAGLCRAALSLAYKVHYIKPVQTGEMDEYFVNFYANPTGASDLSSTTLYKWKDAVSPHVAANLDTCQSAPTDNELIEKLLMKINAFICENRSELGNSDESMKANIFTVLETAGGVLSPSPSRTLQADLYRILRLPIILVGDGRLGGITSTLSSYDVLRVRGYDVHAIVFIEPPDGRFYGNADIIVHHLEKCHGNQVEFPSICPRVFELSALPNSDNTRLLHPWYNNNHNKFLDIFLHLENSSKKEKDRVINMAKRGQEVIWWPFTQHGNMAPEDITFIDSAYKDNFRTYRPNLPNTADEKYVYMTDMFDGCASWWTQFLGHGNSFMSIALGEASGRYGHVMFPQNLHPPAVQLASYMVNEGPGRGWADKVFFSDNGSSGMEIALKMALRLFHHRHQGVYDANDVFVLSQDDGYHGDTLGAMNTITPNPFNKLQHPWYKPCTIGIPIPSLLYKNGRLVIIPHDSHSDEIKQAIKDEDGFSPDLISMWDVDSRKKSPLAKAYKTYAKSILDKAAEDKITIGAFVLEPLMQGAGGIKFIDPLYQHCFALECKKRGIPVVYDEVAVGMYRLGPCSAASVLGVYPDVGVYGKALTGGYLSLSLTVASSETFQSFLGSEKYLALLHGHSFTANPMGCQAALESIRQLKSSPLFTSGLFHGNGRVSSQRKSNDITTSDFKSQGYVLSNYNEHNIIALTHVNGVEGAMYGGSVLSIVLKDYQPNSSSNQAPQSGSEMAMKIVRELRNYGVFARPMGNVLYMMATPYSDRNEITEVIEKIIHCIRLVYV